MKRTLLLVLTAAAFAACSRQSFEQPAFGGLKGRASEVKMYHILPVDWRMANSSDTVMYINASAYDLLGNEIESVLMDSTGRIQSQAQSQFENGVCTHSIQRSASGRTVAEMRLVSSRKGLTVYEQKRADRTEHMEVKERKLFGRYTSVVTVDGKVTMKSTIRTDADGRPVEIITTDAAGNETIQKNTYSEDGNIIEKHVITENGNKDDVTTTKYVRFDKQGNWIEARTFNKVGMASENLVREIKYWQ